MPRARSWKDDDLARAVCGAASLLEVCRCLGLKPGGKTYESLRDAIARLELEASHLSSDEALTPKRPVWTEVELRDAVAASTSLADVMRTLGYTPSGGMYRFVKAKIAERRLDTSHFTGQSWAKGRSFSGRRARPLAEILVRDSTYPSARLRLRLIAAGLKSAECESCGLDEWRGRPLPLALDHINGDPRDNRLENLRILCPNCHALTDTWCARKSHQPA